MLSERLKLELIRARRNGVPNYRLAMAAAVSRSTLSLWMHDGLPVQHGDPRVVKLGAMVGLSAAECFADSPETISA